MDLSGYLTLRAWGFSLVMEAGSNDSVRGNLAVGFWCLPRPGADPKVNPPSGSRIYTAGVSESRTRGALLFGSSRGSGWLGPAREQPRCSHPEGPDTVIFREIGPENHSGYGL